MTAHFDFMEPVQESLQVVYGRELSLLPTVNAMRSSPICPFAHV